MNYIERKQFLLFLDNVVGPVFPWRFMGPYIETQPYGFQFLLLIVDSNFFFFFLVVISWNLKTTRLIQIQITFGPIKKTLSNTVFFIHNT